MVKINNDLKLNYIDENMVRDDKLITVECWFTFYDTDYCVYVKVDSVDDGDLNIISVEGPSVLFDSFESQLEEDDVIEVLRTEIKKYLTTFELDIE